MSEHLPLLVFPSFVPATRDPGRGVVSRLPPPGREKQSASLGPKFETLQQAFEADRIAAQLDPQGLSPEFVLVIETRGRIEDFFRAADSVGMDWLGEIDLDDLDPDEDFRQIDQKTGKPSDKKLDGRLYLAMTNQRALENVLALWRLYTEGKPLGHGNSKWRDLFDCAKDIRRWGAMDRLLKSGILDEWAECAMEDPNASTSFRLELWFQNGEAGEAEGRRIRRQIEETGGEITAVCRIEGIRFHGIKGRIPISVARAALSIRDNEDETGLPALFLRNEVKYFLPVAQGVTTLPQETEAFQLSAPPPSEKPPVVALLDGYPFGNHQQLAGRLAVHDPDELLARYDEREMRHGTAMASLIARGELDAEEPPLSRQIYCRPILEPELANRDWNRGVAEREHIPETAFAEDRIHRAIVEMFETESATAPSVRIVNLSVGEHPFDGELSPWARLIDWLAWEYKLLFCVSAGNQTGDIPIGPLEANFSVLSPEQQAQITIKRLGETQFDRKLLSPGEAINALTVGAQHSDNSTVPMLGNRVDLLPSSDLPSPITRLGPGFRRAIKPEILMPGGRQLYREDKLTLGHYQLVSGYQPPGQKVAAPDSKATGLTDQTAYSRGTSNATALASRAAARLYEVLEELRKGPGGEIINRDTTAPLLKALLVHGALWPDSAAETIGNAIPSGRQNKRTIAKFLGYGIADPARVESCTAQRATVLGGGLLKRDEAHEYHLPLPMELSGVRQWRRLIITLAWLSPVNHRHRAYRQAKLSFSPPCKGPLPLERQQADWRQVQRGTVQHEILEEEKIAAFEDGGHLTIKISAQGDSGQDFDDAVPYGLAVTLEVNEKSKLPIYNSIREKLSIPIKVSS